MNRPSSFRLGKGLHSGTHLFFLITLCSATFLILVPCLIWTTPRCFGLLPDMALCFLMPPLPTLARTTMIPCLALYPNLLARSSLLGLGILWSTGSLLQDIDLDFSSSLLDFHILVQVAEI